MVFISANASLRDTYVAPPAGPAPVPPIVYDPDQTPSKSYEFAAGAVVIAETDVPTKPAAGVDPIFPAISWATTKYWIVVPADAEPPFNKL